MANKLYSLVALAATAIVPATSQAIIVTLDNPHQTVTRLSSGFLDVAYTGTISISPGYEFSSATAEALYSGSGDVIAGIFPNVTFNLTGVLFTVRYDSSDFGLYAYDLSLVDPADIRFAECPIGGGGCFNDGGTFSLNVVDAVAVPEPSTLVLLGAGLLAAAGLRRRRSIAG